MMKKDAQRTEARKADITTAALELFFEKGYEETSIRMIQKKLGKEPGLFYYYFDSKEAVFEAAIEMFFASYVESMEAILEEGKLAPEDTLTRYLDYIQNATESFRGQYLQTLHWSVLGAIREHTMRIMRKYILEILHIYLENNIIKQPKIGLDITANLLAYGIGGSILYQANETYTSQKADAYRLIPMLLDLTE